MDFSSLGSLMTLTDGYSTWLIVAVVLAILGSILTYFLFCRPEKKYNNKFVNWLRDFLNFDAKVIKPLVRITYMFLTIYSVVMAFSVIRFSFLMFLYQLAIATIGLRVAYELIMLLVETHSNVKDINKKMK